MGRAEQVCKDESTDHRMDGAGEDWAVIAPKPE